jgi:hypothetical protein
VVRYQAALRPELTANARIREPEQAAGRIG